MTTEEMEKRWPILPPFKAQSIDIWKLSTPYSPAELFEMKVDQDSIDEIIEYFQAAKESMNT